MSEHMMTTAPRLVTEEERPFWETVARLHRAYGARPEATQGAPAEEETMTEETVRAAADERFLGKVAATKRSLTVDAVAKDETCIVLDEWQCAGHYRTTVAHLSGAGWIDLFIAEIDQDAPQDDRQRHVSLTPSQARELISTYQDMHD